MGSHVVDGLSFLIDDRHSGIGLGNDRHRDGLGQCVDDSLQLIGANGAVDPTAEAPALSRARAESKIFPPVKRLPSDSMVMVHRIGRSQTSRAASRAARDSSRLIMVSATNRSTPASARQEICSL